MTEKPPSDPANHAEHFAHDWPDKLEEYCSIRMQDLGIPDKMSGQPDYDGDGKWHAFDPSGRTGGSNTTGVVTDSGELNPELLKGEKGDAFGLGYAFGAALTRSSRMNTRSCASEPMPVRSGLRRRPDWQLVKKRSGCAAQGPGNHPARLAFSRSSNIRSKPSFVRR